jgi:hypothetical protein
MVKLFLSSTSIGAISLGIGNSVAARYSPQLHLPLISRDFFPLARQGRDHHRRHAIPAANAVEVVADGQLLRRRIQGEGGAVDDDCPGTPFLWKIVEDATGEHVGFGVGTMHLPYDVVLTEASYNSISSAIEGERKSQGTLLFIRLTSHVNNF